MSTQGTLVTTPAVSSTAQTLSALHAGFCLAEVKILPAQGFVVVQGEHRHLSAKAMEILLQLALQAEHIVSSQQLLSAVWGDASAAKVNLTHAISELRHVLGDHKTCPVFIQTLPRRGYRLLQPVRPLQVEPAFVPLVERRGRGGTVTARHRFWLTSLFRGSRLFSVSVACLVSVWLFIQVMAITFPLMNISATGMKLTLLLLLIGFPLILLVTWVFDLRERKKRLALSDSPDKQRYWRRQFLLELVFLLLSFTAVALLARSVKLAIDADSKTLLAADAAVASPVAIANSVAVLPFQLTAGSHLDDYLLDGVRQELLYALTQANRFPVLSDRAMQLVTATADYQQLAAQLRVEYLLEGRLSNSAGQLQLEVSVIEAATGVRRWSTRLTQSLAALPLLQQELLRQVQNAFALILPGANHSETSGEYRITENFAAFDSYMQAQQRLKKFDDMASLAQAEQLLLQALQADPEFAMASASLCKVHLDKYILSRSVEEFSLASQACQHAARLKVNQAQVSATLGDLYRISGQYAEAMDKYQHALALNSRWVDAVTGKAMVFSATGNKAEAEQQFKLAIELEPGYWQNYMLYGGFLYETGQFATAARHLARAAQLKPGSTDVLNSLAAAWFFSGQFAQAIHAWQQVVDLAPLASSFSNLGTAHYFNADYAKAELMYQQALSNSSEDYTIWTNLADVLDVQSVRQHEALPLYQKALALAERNLAVDAKSQTLLSQISRLQSELQQCEAAEQTQQSMQLANQTDFYLFYDLAIASFNCSRSEQGIAYVQQAISLGYPSELVAVDPKIPDAGY